MEGATLVAWKARQIIDAALAFAQEANEKVAVVVEDGSGQQHSELMEGAGDLWLRGAQCKINGLKMNQNDITVARANQKAGLVGGLFKAMKAGDTDVFPVPGCLIATVEGSTWYVAVSGAPSSLVDENIVRLALRSVLVETQPGFDVFEMAPPVAAEHAFATSASKIGAFYNPTSAFQGAASFPSSTIQNIVPPGPKWTTTTFSLGGCASAETFVTESESDPVTRWGLSSR